MIPRQYTPDSGLLAPRQLLNDMFNDLRSSKELAIRLIIRDINAKYRKSILGIGWAFIPALFSALSFILLQKSGIINPGEINVPYPVYVFIGTMFWQFFTDCISAPLSMISTNKGMLIKINFPREALILAAYGEVLIDFFIKFLLILGVMAIYSIQLSSQILLLPFIVISIMFLGAVIGMIIIPIGILFENITKGLPIITNLWMLVTPVAYIIPKDGIINIISTINPVSSLITYSRELLIGSGEIDFFTIFAPIILYILPLFFTWIIYRLSLPILIERIGA